MFLETIILIALCIILKVYYPKFRGFMGEFWVKQELKKLIENNIILSSSNIGNITKIREYKINDLILSNSGKCYKIIQSTSESLFKNYKYDIEYIGQFKTKSSVNAIRAVFTKVTSSLPLTVP